jgi:hypothetical protein
MKANRILVRITFFILVLIQGTACAETGVLTKESQYLTSSELLGRIQKGEAKEILAQLYSDETAWYDLLEKIATADPEWLQVANGLKKAADAGASVELDAAVGEALYNAPDKVLKNSLSVFSMDAICGAPDIDDTRFDSYQLASHEIDRRKAALEQLTNPELSADIQECIQRLEESRKDVARFYGVNK